MRPRQVILTLEALFAQRMGPLSRNGEELHALDNLTVQEVYQQWLLLLLDLGYLPLDDASREWGRLIQSLSEKDILIPLNASAECLQIVYRKFPDGTKGFEALCRKISPNLFNLIKQDVFETINEDNVVAAKRLIQFFAFPTRLSLRRVNLMDQCLDDYMAIERQFEDYLPKGIVSGLNAIMRRWLADLNLQNLSYKHGNGATAGSLRDIEDKYRSISSDDYLKLIYKDDFLPNAYLSETPIWDSQIRCKLERISHTTFVPKSYKTFRTISMEPATLMFIQQGIWRRLDNYVERHRYLKRRIGFHDQQRNKSLAAEGSFSRNYCTIDLSAASDSVSWILTKAVFKGTPLLKHLIATRSKQTFLPNNELISLKKFAPMGSAMCFPIETLIFAACCEYVTREHGYHQTYSVFGDDIIVPTECYNDILYVLTILGFKVNTDKSFYEPECWFRESCGGEYCDGYDVTPLRISRRYYADLDEVGLTGLIDTSNKAQEYGFIHLRSFLIKKMKDNKRFVPLFSPTSIRSDGYSNFHTRRRWNAELQRIECYVSHNKTNREARDERIAYLHALVLLNEEPSINEESPWIDYDSIPSWDDEGRPTDTGKITVVSKRRWAPKPWEASDESFVHYCLSNFEPKDWKSFEWKNPPPVPPLARGLKSAMN
nr:MAG: RNA-dependent RNA polymerase [Riboviria sp.]